MLHYLKRITLANMASLIISCSTAVMSIELLSVRTWNPPKYCISVLVLYNTYNCVLVNTACALCSCYILDEADLSQFIHVYIYKMIILLLLIAFQSLSVNIALASPLLSRFDLVLVLLDTQNHDWDRVVSSYILQGKLPGDVEDDKRSAIWSMNRMQTYISLIKTLNPELTPGATRYQMYNFQCLQ